MIQDRIYKYFDNNSDLHVLFIFERFIDGIKEELGELTWSEDYVYEVFDGAWFNLKYKIEHDWKEKKVVLFFPFGTYMYPHNEENQLKFPLLDILRANMEYQEDDFAAFMQQHQLPDKFRPFVKRHIAELQSSKVSAILGAYYTKEAFSEDAAIRGIISSYLGEKKLLEWDYIIVRMIILGTESEEKKRKDFFVKVSQNMDVKRQIDYQLTSIFGFSYDPNNNNKVKGITESLKYNSITQLLDVSSSDNYKQYKVKNSLAISVLNKIYETGSRDRNLSQKFSIAMQELGADIKEEEIIKIYGVDAQYFYMTEALCWPILEEVVSKELLTSPDTVNERMRTLSLKLPIGSDVLLAISYVEHLALYYDKVRNIGTLKLNTAEEYVQKYVSDYYLIDTFYRQSLEDYHQLVTKEIPIMQTLGSAKARLDADYAKLTNVLNLEWLTCVVEKGKFFDDVSLCKQEKFFANEYDGSVKQVIIISDALRYEVAAELMQELSKEKHIATITPYRAMLPTETKYCKPALLPHQSLTFQNGEMLVDGQTLPTIESRTAHLSNYKQGAVCVTYEDVMNGDIMVTRELFKRPLVYIFHDTIDAASHGQSPFEVIAACRKTIEQLSVLVKRLHATWNVTNVALTSDHGFIYNDIRFEDKDKHSICENCVEKKTRYYITDSNANVDGIVKFPMTKVSGMQSATPLYVCVTEGTNRLAAPGGYSFAHGGATLQEMIIPVIRSSQRRTNKTEKVGVSLLNHNLVMVSSRLKVHIIQSEAVSMTTMERKVVCSVYNGDEEVTQKQTITLNSTDAVNLNNRIFEVTLTLCKNVTSGVLQLRIYDEDDSLNPILKATVKNSTLIETDF